MLCFEKTCVIQVRCKLFCFALKKKLLAQIKHLIETRQNTSSVSYGFGLINSSKFYTRCFLSLLVTVEIIRKEKRSTGSFKQIVRVFLTADNTKKAV